MLFTLATATCSLALFALMGRVTDRLFAGEARRWATSVTHGRGANRGATRQSLPGHRTGETLTTVVRR